MKIVPVGEWMTTDVQIRNALDGDLADLVNIYNHYVENTPFTFDTTTFSMQDRIGWFASFSEYGPHRLMVAERDGQVLGYASSAPFKQRPAYETSVETSVYVEPDNTGHGIGAALYDALLAQLVNDERLHRAYSGVTLPNPVSVALHEKRGFTLAGTYREVGYKLDRYWDVAWYEKDLT